MRIIQLMMRCKIPPIYLIGGLFHFLPKKFNKRKTPHRNGESLTSGRNDEI